MSDAIDQMRKAQEDRFFKLEQEKHLMEYVVSGVRPWLLTASGRLQCLAFFQFFRPRVWRIIKELPKSNQPLHPLAFLPPALKHAQKKLKASGRYDKIPTPAPISVNSANALPQVLAHSVRLSQPTVAEVNKIQMDRSFMTRQVIKGVCTGDPHIIGNLTLGSRVSLGKSKWTSKTPGDMTIWSIKEAAEEMSKAPKHLDGVESRAMKHMVDHSVVEIRGVKYKFFPDPTPGRAMAWGGTLAIWGTAAIVVSTCKIMNIKSMEDLRVVMNRTLSPLGGTIKAAMDPFRTYFAVGGETVTAASLKETDFSQGIRGVFR